MSLAPLMISFVFGGLTVILLEVMRVLNAVESIRSFLEVSGFGLFNP